MTQIKSLFATRLYHAPLSAHAPAIDPNEMEASCYSIAEDDAAGQEWSEANGYPGYTSYASLDDLPYRFPIFADLVRALDAHVAAFARDLAFDLGDKPLKLDSGTTYVAMPDGASAIKFEDPRLAMMMAAPGRVKDAAEELRSFHYAQPVVGDVLLWESWLRHEVPMNLSEDDRLSVSFNYGWG